MEKSPRKPAGKTAFIVATSWLHEETAYAGKLLLLQSWEDVKMIITKFPAPDNFGALARRSELKTLNRPSPEKTRAR